jgi:hypothetical protein
VSVVTVHTDESFIPSPHGVHGVQASCASELENVPGSQTVQTVSDDAEQVPVSFVPAGQTVQRAQVAPLMLHDVPATHGVHTRSLVSVQGDVSSSPTTH